MQENEEKVMICNKKFYCKKFKSMEEALDFVNRYCSNLWTHLFTYVDGEWISSGSTWPKESC